MNSKPATETNVTEIPSLRFVTFQTNFLLLFPLADLRDAVSIVDIVDFHRNARHVFVNGIQDLSNCSRGSCNVAIPRHLYRQPIYLWDSLKQSIQKKMQVDRKASKHPGLQFLARDAVHSQ